MRQHAPVTIRILTVEDDERIRTAVSLALEEEGWEVEETANGEDALAAFVRGPSDVVLIDIMLPGMDGFEVCRRIRRLGDVPIVMVTARADSHDVVAGLEAGADDYLVKPFAFAELLARLRALGRRGRMADADHLVVDTLEIDRVARRATRGGQTIELTTKEFDLLSSLARQTPQVVSRDTLAREAWSETARSATLDNIIDVHISRLRRKIDMEPEAKLIHTVRGVGFALRVDNA